MVPVHETSFELSVPVLRRSYTELLLRTYVVFVVASILVAIWGVWFFFSPTYGPLAGFCLGAIVMLWRFVARGYFAPPGSERYGDDRTIHVGLAEEGLVVRSALSTTELSWRAVDTLHRLREFWFIAQAGNRTSVPLPVAALSPEFQAYLEDRVRASGGKIR